MFATTDVPPLEVKKNKRHTPAQLATLNAYYKNGMVGVGEIYAVKPLLSVTLLKGKSRYF